MVVEILVAQGDGDDPLCQHGLLIVDDVEGIARVGDGRVEGIEKSDAVGDLAKEQRTGIGGEPATVEVGDDPLAAQGGKVEWQKVTVCHAMALLLKG